MTPKDFYKSYLADDGISELNKQLVATILEFRPSSVFEFGCGTGKNLALLRQDENIKSLGGVDISPMGILTANIRHGLGNVAIGDESFLNHCKNYDVVFTCSVLDHIENIAEIIRNFKRISNRAIVLAETNDTPAKFYYPHDYEILGFQKLDYSWTSPKPEGDGATYHIWVWHKSFENKDDFA